MGLIALRRGSTGLMDGKSDLHSVWHVTCLGKFPAQASSRAEMPNLGRSNYDGGFPDLRRPTFQPVAGSPPGSWRSVSQASEAPRIGRLETLSLRMPVVPQGGAGSFFCLLQDSEKRRLVPLFIESYCEFGKFGFLFAKAHRQTPGMVI